MGNNKDKGEESLASLAIQCFYLKCKVVYYRMLLNFLKKEAEIEDKIGKFLLGR